MTTANHYKDDPGSRLQTFSGFRERLEIIYVEMDEQYDGVSRRYGFECTGCADSCCETRFYHHTWIEYLYLISGFRLLGETRQQQIKKTAADADEKHRAADTKGKMARVMCPLNENGRCAVYPYRPMICRLHGIPQELKKPGQQPAYGPGCDLFTKKCGQLPYVPFDRTPFYRKMAGLEQEFRQALGNQDKIKMTIAKMLLHA